MPYTLQSRAASQGRGPTVPKRLTLLQHLWAAEDVQYTLVLRRIRTPSRDIQPQARRKSPIDIRSAGARVRELECEIFTVRSEISECKYKLSLIFLITPRSRFTSDTEGNYIPSLRLWSLRGEGVLTTSYFFRTTTNSLSLD